MAEVFRILDRFNIAEKGDLYILQQYLNSDIHIGDIIFDLQSNRFKVKGIEMVRRKPGVIGNEEESLGLLFELVDGASAEGSILVKNPDDVNFLFCNHPLYPKKVDEDYEEEYQAAKKEHACALFSYENLQLGKLSLYGEEISGLTIYRGWMMKPEMYRDFYNKLADKGIILINTPEEYEKCHMLPGWYESFSEYTACSVWENKGTLESAMALTKGLTGPYIVKDYVKSRKHEWYDACYIPNIEDVGNTEKVIGNFICRQDDDLVGGVVLRQFIKLKQNGFHEKSGMPLSEEYRTFVFAGRVHIVDDYWHRDRQVPFSDEEKAWIDLQAKRIPSNFAAMDLARREDGTLIIMELGDGQVSGLQQIRAEDFYRKFNPDL